MALDAPQADATFGSTLLVSGWAVDAGAPSGTGVDAVHVWAYPVLNGTLGTPTFLGAATLGIARADVGAIFGLSFTTSGYSLQPSGLAPGSYVVVVYAHSTVTGTFNQSASANVTIAGSAPVPMMAVDGPSAGATVAQAFLVTGWALDFGAAAGTGVDAVQIWAYPLVGGVAGTPTYLGAAAYGAARLDIAEIFGAQFANSAYSLSVEPAAGRL